MRVIDANAGEMISASDRGLQYGDGCFETMRVVDELVPLLDWHAARLTRTIRHLDIKNVKVADVFVHVLEHLRQHPGEDWLKLILTRGTGTRGYRPSAQLQPTLILSSGPLAPLPHDRTGVTLSLSSKEIASIPALGAAKHLNRLTEVMAANDLGDKDECLLCDRLGGIVCGMMHNVFIVRDDMVLTPAIDQSGVAGVMRDWLLAHHSVRVGRVTIEDVTQASEVLLTNGVRGIRNAGSFCGHCFSEVTPVGSALRQLLARSGFPQ